MSESYKTLLKEIRETNKWKHMACSQIRLEDLIL